MHIIHDNPNISVVLVYLTNMWRSLPKGEWIPVPFFCDIIIGKPIESSSISQHGIEYLMQALTTLSTYASHNK